MSVQRPGEPLQQSYRLGPISGDRDDDRDDARKKKKVSYHGRSWSEREDDLSVQPTLPAFEREERKGRAVYADQATLERAEKLIASFATVEEKVAQLCFYATEAFYDADVQVYVERLIQKYQIGGLLFCKGDFRRQSYLIECYQKLAKFPLFIGNDFLHGLSFYFQGEIPVGAIDRMNERKYSDLGKAVVSQNRKLGVHFQFDSQISIDSTLPKVEFKSTCARAFRNGIREANGVVARVRNEQEVQVNAPDSGKIEKKNLAELLSTRSGNIAEARSMRTLNFIDLTEIDPTCEIKILEAFHSKQDAFLLKGQIENVIELLSTYIKLGKISETELDKRLLKVLVHKMNHFKL